MNALADAIGVFQHKRPEHAALADQFLQFLASSPSSVFLRSHLVGHFTGSAFVVSADGQRTLLLHHAKLNRWLQPGGHADGDTDLAAVALREATEETGLLGLIADSEIFDLDLHGIPARGAEPAHDHWDVRFVVRAGEGETVRINAESRAARWWPIVDLIDDALIDPSIRRMARRWLAMT